MLEAGSSRDPAANASVTTQDNRQSPSPSIHATLFSTGHPPERRGSKLPSSTFAPWANGHTPHVTEPISAVLGFETRLKCHNDVVILNPKDPTVAASSCQSCPDGASFRPTGGVSIRFRAATCGVPNSCPVLRAPAVTHGYPGVSHFLCTQGNRLARASRVSPSKLAIEFDSRHPFHIIAPSQLIFSVPKLFEHSDDKNDQAGDVYSMIIGAIHRSALSGGTSQAANRARPKLITLVPCPIRAEYSQASVANIGPLPG
jgi:hypothetical protein